MLLYTQKNSMNKKNTPKPQLSNTQRTHQQTLEDKTTKIQLRTQMVFTFLESSLTQNQQKKPAESTETVGVWKLFKCNFLAPKKPANWITSPQVVTQDATAPSRPALPKPKEGVLQIKRFGSLPWWTGLVEASVVSLSNFFLGKFRQETFLKSCSGFFDTCS